MPLKDAPSCSFHVTGILRQIFQGCKHAILQLLALYSAQCPAEICLCAHLPVRVDRPCREHRMSAQDWRRHAARVLCACDACESGDPRSIVGPLC